MEFCQSGNMACGVDVRGGVTFGYCGNDIFLIRWNLYVNIDPKVIWGHIKNIQKIYLEFFLINLEKLWKYHGILSVRKCGKPVQRAVFLYIYLLVTSGTLCSLWWPIIWLVDVLNSAVWIQGLSRHYPTLSQTKNGYKTSYYWWLVRVTLVVDWWVLPQNFGPVVGTYEGLLRLCEWTFGGDSSSRWWGQTSTICHHQTFIRQWWWGP